MKIILFYFSGTGNTWWTSSQLKMELENLGHTIEMYSLENPIMEEEGFVFQKIKEADHIIIGYPIYGSDLPANMKEFVNNLPDVSDSKGFSAFCTQASFSGNACIYFKQKIEEKGYRFQQSFQINLTTNFHVPILPFCFFRPAEGTKLERIKSKASKKIKMIAGKISKDEKYIEGTIFYQVVLGGLQRSFFRRHEKTLPLKFNFTKGRCVKCKLCVKTCPRDNIILETENLDLKRKDNCLLCFRCYNFCPGLAINFGKNIMNPEKYKRYLGPIARLQVSDIRK